MFTNFNLNYDIFASEFTLKNIWILFIYLFSLVILPELLHLNYFALPLLK